MVPENFESPNRDRLLAISEAQRRMYDAFCGVKCMDCEQPIWWHWMEKGEKLEDSSYSDGFAIELTCEDPQCGSIRRYGPESFERFPWHDPAH
jgi:hypothetical protein